MILILHMVSAFILVISHALFLVRSAWLVKKKRAPEPFDRLTLNLSQLLLPLVILTGAAAFLKNGTVSFLHMAAGLAPLLLMFLFRKRSFRKKHPFILPLLNGLLLAAALLSGLFLN